MEATRQDLHVDSKAGAAPASAAKADGAPAVTDAAVTDAAVTDAGTAVTDAAVTDAGTVTDAVTASVAKDGVSFTVKGLTLEREAAGTRVSIESLASRGRRVNRPGTAPPSEDGTSDAGLPVGGEPEPAESDDGVYDGIDDLDGLFDDEPDDFVAAREVTAVEKESATGTRGETQEQGGRTDVRACLQFRMPEPPGADGFAPSFCSPAKPFVTRATAAAERVAGQEEGVRCSRAGRGAPKTPERHGSGTEAPATEDEGRAPRR